MKLLKQQKSKKNTNISYICKEKIEDKHAKDENYCKVRDHYHYTREYGRAAHSICNLENNIPKKLL